LACNKDNPNAKIFALENVFLGNQMIDLESNATLQDIPADQTFDLIFTKAIDQNSVAQALELRNQNGELDLNFNFFNDGKTLKISPAKPLSSGTTYTLSISNQLRSQGGDNFEGWSLIFSTVEGKLELINWQIANQSFNEFSYLQKVPLDAEIRIEFSAPINPTALESAIEINGKNDPNLIFSYEENSQVVNIQFTEPLDDLAKYEFKLAETDYGSTGKKGEAFQQTFYTDIRSDFAFPELSDEELLTKIQEQTFKYFWEFGHPISGLARERNTSGNLVTMGGSGFGLMAMIVGVERNFITRAEAVEHWETIVNFLSEADRFHGAFPHWMNGTTGKVIPFSERDNGGDLVETAFLMQGLLTVREYLDTNDTREQAIIEKINQLWEAVEWTWYTKNGEKQLYWHWSPDREFAINLRIRGHNETQIVYILAAASPTHPIDLETYQNGYARNGQMQNGNTYYQKTLALGPNFGGPLFFSHYSYLGLDPRNLKDQYADYWSQNINHSLINQAYCKANPKNYVGYSENCWGLTASDSHNGYSAHSPNNDLGVITPTAAISSIPYTPEESIAAIRHFYYKLGDRLWGEYGFYDAFNPTEEWVASSYLAIDQGPIICMIENYRTQLLWELLMSAPEVQSGLEKLEFEY